MLITALFTDNGGSSCIYVSIKGKSKGKDHPRKSYEEPDRELGYKSTVSFNVDTRCVWVVSAKPWGGGVATGNEPISIA